MSTKPKNALAVPHSIIVYPEYDDNEKCESILLADIETISLNGVNVTIGFDDPNRVDLKITRKGVLVASEEFNRIDQWREAYQRSIGQAPRAPAYVDIGKGVEITLVDIVAIERNDAYLVVFYGKYEKGHEQIFHLSGKKEEELRAAWRAYQNSL